MASAVAALSLCRFSCPILIILLVLAIVGCFDELVSSLQKCWAVHFSSAVVGWLFKGSTSGACGFKALFVYFCAFSRVMFARTVRTSVIFFVAVFLNMS